MYRGKGARRRKGYVWWAISFVSVYLFYSLAREVHLWQRLKDAVVTPDVFYNPHKQEYWRKWHDALSREDGCFGEGGVFGGGYSFPRKSTETC